MGSLQGILIKYFGPYPTLCGPVLRRKAMIAKIKKYFYEVRTEFRHVSWPTRAEATRLTGIVIGLSIGLAIFLGAFDYFFLELLRRFVVRS